MTAHYSLNVERLKALGDTNRFMIADMLSDGELCACKILEKFDFTQPALSYHMKMLCDCGLVNTRKDGKWTHYSLDQAAIGELKEFIDSTTSPSNICIGERKAW